ncbi:MAG TPA: diaminopimelate decarboxylase [Acidimicrobiales bacterium]|nr:diaminopimelate decarboxylase [Acidimicrobiales bacterium]
MAPDASTAPVERALLPDTAVIAADGRLSVGGCDLVSLAEAHGTPLFVYDEAHLEARCAEARAAFDDGVAYASKAFLCRAMARLAHAAGLCIDVASAGELHCALRAGVPAGRLVLHGNFKSDDELAVALEAGVGRVVVDGADDLARLERRSRGRTVPQPTLLRVTPGVEAHTHEFVRTGQEDSKFGVSIVSGEATRLLGRIRDADGLALVGLHAHIGSQVFDVGSLAQAARILAEFFAPLGLDELCVGGGLGVPYVAGETAPSITEWGRAVRAAVSAAGVPSHVRVTAEPGRSVVAAAGLTLYTVGAIKELEGVRTYVAVDGGMSDNPRPVLYGSGYEAFLPRVAAAPRRRAVRVVGKHCESGDVLVDDARLPSDVAVGDVLCTPVTGAYGYSMASTYNRVGRPPVVFVREGTARVVLRRETPEDLESLECA